MDLKLSEIQIDNILNVEVVNAPTKSILFICTLYFLQNVPVSDLTTIFENFDILNKIIEIKLRELGQQEIENILVSKNFEIVDKPLQETKKPEQNIKQTKKEEEFEDIFI